MELSIGHLTELLPLSQDWLMGQVTHAQHGANWNWWIGLNNREIVTSWVWADNTPVGGFMYDTIFNCLISRTIYLLKCLNKHTCMKSHLKIASVD